MNTLKKILDLVNGKKTTIVSVVMLIVIFSVNRSWIPQDVAELISAIFVALGFSANYANYKLKK